MKFFQKCYWAMKYLVWSSGLQNIFYIFKTLRSPSYILNVHSQTTGVLIKLVVCFDIQEHLLY